MKRNCAINIFSISILLMISTLTNAQHEARRFEHGPGRWHRGNIHRFEAHDRIIWRGGHWQHARYGGRLGWWWIVGPSWYFYSRPIYPYPDPYQPSVIVEMSKESQSTTAAAPAPQNWYYCEASKDYYPYVSACPGGWKTVPATPPSQTPIPPPR